MPKAGDQIIVSEHQSLTFLQTAAETNGELLQVRAIYKPQSSQPPAHYHPRQREFFEVRSGKFRAVIGGQESIFHPGDRFEVPAGTVHWMHNIAPEQGELLWETRPALKTAHLLAALWSLERDQHEAGAGPNLLQAAVLLPEFYDEFHLAKPPFLIQKLLFGVLAPVGRAQGYRGSAALAGT